MDNKFRYALKHNINHSIIFEYFTLEQIERGEALKLLAKLELEWNLIARDEWTGFFDINGEPKRELWDGDIVKTRGEYRLIYFNKIYGQWMGETEHQRLGLYLLLDAYGAKYAGNIHDNPELAPWWKEDQNGH